MKVRSCNNSFQIPCHNRFSALYIEKCEINDQNDITYNEEKKNTQQIKKLPKFIKKNKKEIKTSVHKANHINKVKNSESKEQQKILTRCSKCFFSHTPFKRFCKVARIKESKKKREIVLENIELDKSMLSLVDKRIRFLELGLKFSGGAKSDGLMIKQAIESARKHSIKLVAGKLNRADGNCAFESVINNINSRDCYQD